MINLDLWKQRKKELNLNYDDLARISGVSKRSIEEIFRGATPTPRISTVQAIERALGISSGAWVENDNASSAYIPKRCETALEAQMLDLFREVRDMHGEKGQERAIQLVRTAFIDNDR